MESEDMPVLVVGLMDVSVQEQAFQFIVINNKAARVPTDNVKAIIEGINENDLRNRLLISGVSYGPHSPALKDVDSLPNSPFRELLDWPANRDGNRLVPLTAIEQSLRYIVSAIPIFEDDEDTRLQVFLAMWNAAKDRFPTFWGKENVFMSKVSITALNEYLVDKIKAAWEFDRIDIFDTDSVRSEAAEQVAKLNSEFWSRPWSAKVQDNANVRSMIKVDVERMAFNSKAGKPWHYDLRLISPVDE